MAICNIIIATFESFMELLASLNHTKQNKILEFYHIYHTREISENIKILFHDQNLSPQTPFLAYNLKYIELNYLSFLQVFFKAFFYTWWLNFSCHFQFCFYSSFFFFFAEQAIFQPGLKSKIDYMANFSENFSPEFQWAEISAWHVGLKFLSYNRSLVKARVK